MVLIYSYIKELLNCMCQMEKEEENVQTPHLKKTFSVSVSDFDLLKEKIM